MKLYYTPPSLYSRPVWLALLEKNLNFELISVDLSGKQFETEFLQLNPFSHVPILVDNGFKLIESVAILDYLEAKYPIPSLLPNDPEMLGIVTMVKMVGFNELLPAIGGLIMYQKRPEELEYSQLKLWNCLKFLEDLLEQKISVLLIP